MPAIAGLSDDGMRNALGNPKYLYESGGVFACAATSTVARGASFEAAERLRR